MSTWSIVLISVVSAIVVIGGIVAIVYFKLVKRKKKEAKSTTTSNSTTAIVDSKEKFEVEDTKEETVILTAARRLKGSSKSGLETNKEFKERVSKLSKEEFIALGIEVDNNAEREDDVIYAYNAKGNLVKTNYELLTRVFKK